MELAACGGGGAGSKLLCRLLRRAAGQPYYGRLSTDAEGGIRAGWNRWLSKVSEPASRIISCGVSKLSSSVFYKPLPAPPSMLAPSGSNQMAKLLLANRVAFFKAWDENINFFGRFSASQAPTLQPDMYCFSHDHWPLVELASGVSELAIDELTVDEKLKSEDHHPTFTFSKSSTLILSPPPMSRSFPFSPFAVGRISQNHWNRLPKESRLSRRLYHSSESHNQCWSCGEAAVSWPFLACDACRSVQPVDPSVDYFQIFGLEKTYEIRDTNLEGKYKDWQKKLHPDLVHSKSEKEKTFAAEQSARVIDAYRTLSKPLSRALYLLQLEGVHVDEEKTLTEPDILAEMMEIREAVEEASDSDSLKQIQSQIQTKLDNWSSSFREAFEKQNFDDAITSILRMRYYDRAIEAIVKKL
ncbi:hypothetical protein J5N97_027484 [Dioscorea zingiberensis]|uniref:J domain-containing protein n=1 Tax=Dioscorea zingiberensis TaxID=325984 RepID=A0A9D5H7N0_9LILI|nr:hypothetical protein J5N97_027484 [Dioscorea zingiberensis]